METIFVTYQEALRIMEFLENYHAKNEIEEDRRRGLLKSFEILFIQTPQIFIHGVKITDEVAINLINKAKEKEKK